MNDLLEQMKKNSVGKPLTNSRGAFGVKMFGSIRARRERELRARQARQAQVSELPLAGQDAALPVGDR